MADEDVFVKGIRQIIPSSGLWLRMEGLETDEGHAEFVPVIAIALLEIEPPHDRFFTDCAYMPLTPDDLMYGWVERFPYQGLRVRYTAYHEVDFQEVGVRLKPGVKPRSWHVTAKGSIFERARTSSKQNWRASRDRRPPSLRTICCRDSAFKASPVLTSAAGPPHKGCGSPIRSGRLPLPARYHPAKTQTGSGPDLWVGGSRSVACAHSAVCGEDPTTIDERTRLTSSFSARPALLFRISMHLTLRLETRIAILPQVV